jgi:hypothetical protein
MNALRVRFAPAALAFAAAACAGAARGPAATQLSAFGGLIRFQAAPGWTLDDRPALDDGAVVLSSGAAARIRLYIREGDPQKDALVQALEKAPWDAPSGGPARPVGTIRAAGTEVPLLRRVSEGVREEPGEAPTYFTDEFCVVPFGGRFLLLVFDAEDHVVPPSPDSLAARMSGWRALLASLKIKS